MKDKLFRIISALTSLLIVFSSTAVFARSEEVYEDKLTVALQEKLETAKDDEKIDVYLWAVDIDYDKVETETLKKTGVSRQKIDELSVSMQDGYFEKNGIKNSTAYISGEKSVDLKKWTDDTAEVREVLDEKVDLYISSKREIAREQYDEVNTKTLKALGVSEKEIIFKSQYSPMFIASLTKAKIEKLAKSGLVAFMDEYVELKIAEEELVEELVDEEVESKERFAQKVLESVSPMAAAVPFVGTMNQHKADIDLDQLSSAFNGNNIIIGQIETGSPDQSDSYLQNSWVNTYGDTETTSHATRVARIIVGREGVAPSATLLSYAVKYGMFEYEAIEYLISRGVSIINQSAAWARTNKDMYYSVMEKWIEHVSMQHHVTFVVVAGNDGDRSNHAIDVPGLAYNVITVGNLHEGATTSKDDDYISNDSSYANGGTSGCAKPDLIAPGCDFYSYSGTSYAAPMVTGTIALMMQMNSALKTNPVLVKAIITASCDRKARDSAGGAYSETMGGLTAKQGAGVINALNCMSIIGNGRFSSSSTYDALVTTNFYCTGSGRKNFALAYEIRNFANGNHLSANVLDPPSVTVLPYINYDLNVFDYYSAGTIGTSTLTNSSVELVSRVTSSTRFMVIMNGQAVTGYPFCLA